MGQYLGQGGFSTQQFLYTLCNSPVLESLASGSDESTCLSRISIDGLYTWPKEHCSILKSHTSPDLPTTETDSDAATGTLIPPLLLQRQCAIMRRNQQTSRQLSAFIVTIESNSVGRSAAKRVAQPVIWIYDPSACRIWILKTMRGIGGHLPTISHIIDREDSISLWTCGSVEMRRCLYTFLTLAACLTEKPREE